MIRCAAAWCPHYAHPPKMFCDEHWYKIPFLNRMTLIHQKEHKAELAATIKWLAKKEGHWGGNTPKIP